MPVPKRNATLSFLGFGIVLFIAVLCRPYTATLFHRIEYTDVVDYGDGTLGSSISNIIRANELSKVIGIDFGRACSRVGVFRNNVFEIISDEQGRSAIPNYVAFLDRGPPLVGFEAKEQALSNPKNTIYDFRRLIGRSFSDPELQEAIKELPYDVVDASGEPLIKIGTKHDYTGYTPEDISELVLRKLKSMAEIHLNTTVGHAVITVPSYFDGKQRQATQDAAAAAELSVLRVINEASAIGLAHRLDIKPCDEAAGRFDCTYILYDIREKESELTLLSIDRGVFEIVGTVGDGHLGWEDFEVPSETAHVQLKAPSNQQSERILALVKRLLLDARLEKKDVDGIIVTGDPLQISKIQAVLEAYFPDKIALTPSGFGHDQAIVCGAATQGQLFSEVYQDSTPQWTDVNPLSLGIETSTGAFLRVINRNSVIPTRKARVVSTSADTQGKVTIRILEGEREVASKNKLIGTLELTGISTEPKGVPEIEISFELDADEILTATAKLKWEESEVAKLVVAVRRRRYTEQEIDDIVREGEKFHEEDLELINYKY
ncbi:Uncharacterized protein BP5553_07250 [Venustampulla echinocandica]|uniref:Actin-like ATPase n=1 Tax=Venustampulla echinocandica TaxID=2656787 RepID=A0A370TIX4_9HELO|nr:Uncharacterized protein BP5553_07250 [Venustampulla echinocandica]RDL35319.1 Uncharacterized protein BP5553_07250 [Venustampulla echinocandica]